MNKRDYNKISIEHFAKRFHLNVLTEKYDFLVSQGSNVLEERSFDFDFPCIVEGIVIVFFTQGNARVKINLTEYDVCRNTLLIIIPNSIVQLLQKSDDLKIEFLFFTFDFISNIRLIPPLGNITKAVEEQPCLYLTNDAFRDLLTVHSFIEKQYRKHILYKEEVIKNLLYALAYQILQLYAAANAANKTTKIRSRKEETYMEFMTLLFEFYSTKRSIQFYAHKLHLTPKYFSKIIKETSGKPVLKWIDEMVIMSAKALLKSSDMTVAQIADELNFINPSFFGTYFSKRVGMTPMAYRKK